MKYMNRNIKALPILFLLGMALFSCTKEGSYPAAGEGEPATIVLSTFGTRAQFDGTEEEPDDAFSSLRVMIFRKGATLAYNEVVDLTQGNPFTIEMTTGDYDFVFIANEDSDTETRPGGKTLTQILNDYTGRSIHDIYGEYFSSSAFRNDYTIPMTRVIKNVRVHANGTVTVGGNASAEPSPWEVAVERAAIRIDLILKATEQRTAENFSAFQLTNVPEKVYFFGEDRNGSTLYNVTGSGSFEGDNPVLPYRSIAGNDGDEYRIDQGAEIFTESDQPIEFVEDPTTPGTYYWYKRIILPSSMFADASDEDLGIRMTSVVSGRPLSAVLGTDLLGYTADRNQHYRLEGTLKAAEPIEFTVVEVTPWGQATRILLIPLIEPDYFVIDHTYSGEDYHLHMVTQDQEYGDGGYSWYVYANVPEDHNSEDVPPGGEQGSPPREFSCASLYSRDASNPWRLPTRDELWAIRDYVYQQRDEADNFVHVSVYNFRNNGWYWSATAPTGLPDQAYGLQVNYGGIGNFNMSKNNRAMRPGAGARCVRNKSGSGGGEPQLPSGVELTVTPSPAVYLADGNEASLTVASNVKWIAMVKSASNRASSGDASVMGQPLITGFDGGSVDGAAVYGTDGTNTSLPLKFITANYMTPLRLMSGDLVIEFREASTGRFLREFSVRILAAADAGLSPTVINLPADPGGQAFSITDSSGLPWTVASNASWLTISETNAVGNDSQTGTGNASFYAESNTGLARSGTVTLSRAGMANRTITVNQAAPYITIPDSYPVDSGNSPTTVSLVITTNLQVPLSQLTASITGNANGLITGVSVNAVNGTLDVTVAASHAENTLTGTVQLSYGQIVSNTASISREGFWYYHDGRWFSPLFITTYNAVQNGTAQSLCPSGSTLAQNETEARWVAPTSDHQGTQGASTWVNAPYAEAPGLWQSVSHQGSLTASIGTWSNHTRCIRR